MDHYASKRVTRIAFRILMICSILAICVFISGCKARSKAGCKDCAIIWSAKSQSPDKHFIASARTEQFGVLGSAAVITTVYLTQREQLPGMILSLSYKSAYPSGITNVDMTWVTHSHLNITYREHATIDYQAIKCAGVEITIEKKAP